MKPTTTSAIAAIISMLTLSAFGQGKLQYRSPSEVDLPPINQRKVVGTWLNKPYPKACTRSIEEVAKKSYMVFRCYDGSGGKTGEVLNVISPGRYGSTTSPTGDNYTLLPNGNLMIRDRDGPVDIEVRLKSVLPSKVVADHQPLAQETSSTLDLTCYAIGFRFGDTATRAANGKPVNPAWDFSIPDRCKTDPETSKGIKAGVSAVL